MSAAPPLATPEATDAHAEAADAVPAFFRAARDLTVSSLGMGSYLGDVGPEANEAYRESAWIALERGVNLLDTAINYRRHQSERDLGQALADHGDRQEVVVSTKGGFLQPPADFEGTNEEWVRRELVDEDVVAPSDIVGGMHCMTPDYLRDQLDRSLANLGLEAVDVYFVHNPETQLQQGVDRDEVHDRLREAFAALEREVDRGRIGCYGVATWDAFRVPPEGEAHLGVERILELAREARDRVNEEEGRDADHGFGAVQLPVNLAMHEAVTEPTQEAQGETVPALEALEDRDLLVLASASLFQGRILGRIPDDVKEVLGADDDVTAAIEFVRSAPAVTTALVGMGSPEHARSNVDAMVDREPRPDAVRKMMQG
jgi:aryl-alcohol dehydrogenase-like predicted oxidoreductase